MLRNKALISALFFAGATSVGAQSVENSPYTRYGLGELSEQVFANNAAMGGVGYALRTNEHINPMNPASYTAVDSLSFMFDAGMSIKSSNFKEAGYKANAKNASFDYLVMQFRLHPRLGFALGYTPYSKVGYNFYRTKDVANSEVKINNTCYGDGGLQQVFAGLGFKILDNLSIGANIGYMYGKLKYSTTADLSNGGDKTVNYQNLSVSNYKADFGIQYTQKLNKDQSITLGLVYGLGHTLNSTYTWGTQVTDNSSYLQTQEHQKRDAFGIPHSFGAGLSWKYADKLTVETDYSLQKWADVTYNEASGMYKDRSKVSFGAEYLPNSLGRNFLARLRYRVGAYYTSPYLRVPGDTQGNLVDGPKEYGVSGGFGIPLKLNRLRSMLSITGQYVHVSPSVGNLLSEDRFVLKVGLTFNERWFMKWRVN